MCDEMLFSKVVLRSDREFGRQPHPGQKLEFLSRTDKGRTLSFEAVSTVSSVTDREG